MSGFSVLAWLRENGLPDDYFCAGLSGPSFCSGLFGPTGVDEGGWPLRDGPEGL